MDHAGRGVDADGLDFNAVFEKAQLFKAFEFFVLALRQRAEFFQDIGAVTIEADMLEDRRGVVIFAKGRFIADGGDDEFGEPKGAAFFVDDGRRAAEWRGFFGFA